MFVAPLCFRGLPGHLVYDRVRNALEFIARKFGKVAAAEALALATVLVQLGGGSAIRQEASGQDVFLEGGGNWLSDLPLSKWEGVTVDPAAPAGLALGASEADRRAPRALHKTAADI